jgi:hypothetical protein
MQEPFPAPEPRRRDNERLDADNLGPVDSDATADPDLLLETPDLLEESQPGETRRAILTWLALLGGVAAIALVVLFAGNRFYNPESRLPVPASYPVESGLYGASEPIRAELRSVESLLGVQEGGRPVVLSQAGRVYEVELPRTLADRLFGKRKERATVFFAQTDSGLQIRFLALRDGSSPLFAIEAPSGLRRPAIDVEGIYIGLPLTDGSPYAQLLATLADLLAQADAADATTLTPDDYTIFGPFADGDSTSLARRVENNLVLDHLADRLDDEGADVSLTAPVFSIRAAPDRGVIKATYQPRQRLVQEPLGYDSATSSLAHELTHAFMDRVATDSSARLRSAAAYFEAAHPRLFGEVVGDLYERLDSSGRAEETLAFLMGSIAAEDTRTVAPGSFLRNQGLSEISESILASDIELLVSLGLLPDCMGPQLLGAEREVTFAYYEAARSSCS